MVLTRQGEWHQVMTVTASNWQCTVCAAYTHKIKPQGCITAYCSEVKCKRNTFKMKHELYSLTLSHSHRYCRDESFYISLFLYRLSNEIHGKKGLFVAKWNKGPWKMVQFKCCYQPKQLGTDELFFTVRRDRRNLVQNCKQHNMVYTIL